MGVIRVLAGRSGWRRRRAGAVVVAALTVIAGAVSVPPATAGADAEVTAWGADDGSGQLAVPAGLHGVAAISAGARHDLALLVDGTVVAWGDPADGRTAVPDGLADVTAISAGADHSLALRSDGTVVAWGDDTHGQATVPADLTGVTAISAGADHSLALRSDGTVVAWGDDTDGQSTVPADLTGVAAVAAGSGFSLALTLGGAVVAWGNAASGAGQVPAGLGGVAAIAAGPVTGLAVTTSGTVDAWGDPGPGVLPVPADPSGVAAVSAGRQFGAALMLDGTVVTWGYAAETLAVPADLRAVSAISCAETHCLALHAATTSVTATFTLLEPIACVRLSTSTVEFGSVRMGHSVVRPDATALTSCGDDATVYASSSPAESTGPAHAVWQPVAVGAATLCDAATPPVDSFAYRLSANGTDTDLTTDTVALGTLRAGATRTDTHTLTAACTGSHGAGETFRVAVTYTATAD